MAFVYLTYAHNDKPVVVNPDHVAMVCEYESQFTVDVTGTLVELASGTKLVVKETIDSVRDQLVRPYPHHSNRSFEQQVGPGYTGQLARIDWVS